jgi:hypothetical protein
VSDLGGADAPADLYPPGTRVEVRSRFEDTWSAGLEVASVEDDGTYRLRRLSDGELLPAFTGPDDVRRERKRETWWL